MISDLTYKVDTHNHADIENELEKLKLENSKITSEYKII